MVEPASPLPWQYQKRLPDDEDDRRYITDAKGMIVAPYGDRDHHQDPEYIVAACNAYQAQTQRIAELEGALREMFRSAQERSGYTEESFWHRLQPERFGREFDGYVRSFNPHPDTIFAARAALSQPIDSVVKGDIDG